MAEWKTCTRCGETKPATSEYFVYAHVRKDGTRAFRPVCKECTNVSSRALHSQRMAYKKIPDATTGLQVCDVEILLPKYWRFVEGAR